MNNSSKYRIAIIGYGRMGHEIEKIIINRNHELAFTVDPFNSNASFENLESAKPVLSETDAIIDFSFPDAVLPNSKIYTEFKIPSLIGTTGWETHREEIKNKVDKEQATILYGGNFSIGAHLIIKINSYAAKLIRNIEDYDIAVMESHHSKKKDRPSGTALMIANNILEKLQRKKSITIDLPQHSEVNKDELLVVSNRIGSEIGLHETIIDSDFDTIKLSHHARSRGGFALGAVLGIEWLLNTNQKGFIHVDEFISSFLDE